jgi:hypothetical protein
MNLQEQIQRIQEMMGLINEGKLESYLIKRYDKIFDELELVRTYDDVHQYNWINPQGEIVFERNNWGVFWVYNCVIYKDLYEIPKFIGISFEQFEKILINYLNNKYKEQFNKKPLKNIGNERCEEEDF